MKHFFTISALIILLLLILEVVLRSRYGLGNPLLYKADKKMGYLIAPNQNVIRNGNSIRINRYSMRSDEISDRKIPGERRFFFIGDSVTNGGWWNPQDSIISERFKRHLQENQIQENQTDIATITILNASANSWSPRNELEYLRQFGLFDADMLILIINTDDLFGTAPNSLLVGREKNYLDRKPMGAIGELIERYRLSKLPPSQELQAIHNEEGDRVAKILRAIQAIHKLSRDNNAKFLMLMTPLLREVDGNSRNYELIARDRLYEFTKKEGINYIDLLEPFKASGNAKQLYHDNIHLNAVGNEEVSQVILKALL
ncbi:MAG: SGNH/GDSL hydrolase family protein [Alkalinema sp. CAN_BIN05]|nr:SGNH/GDSL hydrolase family protein [Alkalinema sp. CAN_BIN05]